NAQVLTEGIKKIPGLRSQTVGNGVNHSYSYYSVIMDLNQFKCSRDEFVEALKAENIECAVHYPIPLTEQPVFRRLHKIQRCPVSEDISKRIFSIPVHPYLSREDLDKVLEALRKVSNHYLK
ncbi:MAG: DegT/DnrJ/EryC1/StrS family aminotransferase, partial [Candidatus Bathyarchaeia archaeon]